MELIWFIRFNFFPVELRARLDVLEGLYLSIESSYSSVNRATRGKSELEFHNSPAESEID